MTFYGHEDHSFFKKVLELNYKFKLWSILVFEFGHCLSVSPRSESNFIYICADTK